MNLGMAVARAGQCRVYKLLLSMNIGMAGIRAGQCRVYKLLHCINLEMAVSLQSVRSRVKQ